LAAAYSESYPHVHVELVGSDSRRGVEQVQRGTMDLAVSSLLPAEEDGASSSHETVVIGRDGIALIVHPTNPVDELTLLQLRDLYAGWTLMWDGVGGAGTGVQITSREDGSGIRAAFEDRVMSEQPVTLTAVVMPTGGAVVDYVSRHSGAIGYVSMAPPTLSEVATPGAAEGLVKVLRIEGADPEPQTVQSGVYHLTYPLHLVSRAEPGDDVSAFVDFVLDPAGQAIVGQRYGRAR
jgi:phosphate transport system substrate-binding protein